MTAAILLSIISTGQRNPLTLFETFEHARPSVL